MTKKITQITIGVVIALFFTALVGMGVQFLLSNKDKNLMLYLEFNEKSGTEVKDSSGNQSKQEVKYLYEHAVYKENEEPQWRESGVKDGALLFDGNSTYITYKADELCAQGEELTISVWVAPRAFEWDDPAAEENGTESLTAIVSQYDKEKKSGILLGYQRYGKLCFQVGTGDHWYTLWSDESRLEKYQWNQVTAIFNGTNGSMSLYLNGQKIAEQKITNGCRILPADREKFMIGKNTKAESIAAGTYNMFSGLMDELKIYDKAFTEEQIVKEEAQEVVFEDIWLENILTDDVYKTQYHGGPYQFWMNEPHAPIYYNGMYHLFYQNNMIGTYWRNICWGHLVSSDMVNWTPIKEAITPTENSVVPDGVWSGGATTDINGVPVLFFTAGNDSYAKEGLISNQNIGVAYPEDLTDPYLTNWVITDELAVEQKEGMGRTGEFRDPSVWKEDGVWYMLICSGSTSSNGGSALLYQTDTLEVLEDGTVDMKWEYKGPIYEMEEQSSIYGTSWELPILLPIENEEGTIKKYIFMISPAPAATADNKVYYFIGDFNAKTGKFIPDDLFSSEPKMLDYGTNVFTGPSAFVDPVSGDICMFSIMQDQRNGAEEGAAGWAHCVGLTRKLWLNDNGTDVKMSPIESIDQLEDKVLIEKENLTVQEANDLLRDIEEDMLHIEVSFEANEANEFSLELKSDFDSAGTIFKYDVEKAIITGRTSSPGKAASMKQSSGQLALEKGCLIMDIYVDRSLVEAYFNETKSITIRSYSDSDARGIRLNSNGNVKVKSLRVASMNSIY